MAVEQARQVFITVSPKSVRIAVVLAALFGPLGMFYSTVTGAIVMILVTGVVSLVTLGIGFLFTWPVCIIWGAVAASSHNKKLMSGAM